MQKIFLILISVIFLSACTEKTINVEDQLTFEEKFELKIKNCNLLKTSIEINDCKDDILLQQAINLDDNSYCDFTSSLKAKKLCHSLFYLDKAQKNNQQSFCNLIEDITIKDICFNVIQA